MHLSPDRTVPHINTFLCAIVASISATIFVPLGKPFPYIDDWVYVSMLGSGWRQTVRWIFTPHNDHRIPLMKALQYGVLRLCAFDFRVLIGINVVVGVFGAWTMFQVARRFRGRSHVGDLIIPLILLNGGFMLFAWGFALQFVLAVATSCAFLLLLGAALNRGSKGLTIAAMCSLLVCAVTGTNGLVVATTVAAGVLASVLRRDESPVRTYVRYGALAILLVAVGEWLMWKPAPTSVSVFSAPAHQVATFAYHLVESSFATSASSGGWWRAPLIICLVVSALVAVTGALRSEPIDPFRAAVYATFVGYIALYFSVVVGRAAGPWFVGLEMHYGYLVALLPILAWVIISRAARPRHANGIALVLLASYGAAFITNGKWRIESTYASAPNTAQIAALLRSGTPPEQITEAYMVELYYIDKRDTRAFVNAGIAKLRSYLYATKRQAKDDASAHGL